MASEITKTEEKKPAAVKPIAGLPTELVQAAQVIFGSGLFPTTKSLNQALVKVMFGRALGLSPAEAQWALHAVPGKPPSISSQYLAAKCKRSGRYDYRIRAWDAKVCRIEFFERAHEPPHKFESLGFFEFTIEEAKKAGLTSKDNWQNFPKSMLFARALTGGVRGYCPDLTFGVPAYSHEEMGNEEAAAEEARRAGWEEAEFTVSERPSPLLAEDTQPITFSDHQTPAGEEQVQRLIAYATEAGVDLTEIQGFLRVASLRGISVGQVKQAINYILNK